MNPIRSIREFLHHTAQSTKRVEEIRDGIDNQSELINRKLTELIKAIESQTRAINNLGKTAASSRPQSIEEALAQQQPLMLARKTFNTNHPHYEPEKARNFPGKIINSQTEINNTVYDELKKMIHDDEIAEHRWSNILRETLEEVKTVPHADQVFERKAYTERYLEGLEAKYQAYYCAGWVNLDDALFLYWVVRQMKPKVIVQTGVCNGLSSAFMMLALAKNGPDGSLHVIDLPQVFNPNDPTWTVKDKAYGVVIPEGKTSGWLVPDAYQSRFEVLNGDAKVLLPGLLQKLGKVDMFYHDSDHTYDHMIFEFDEAKKFLTKSGVIVSDDISWNSSLWDFADQYHVPAYNYRGSMGIACF